MSAFRDAADVASGHPAVATMGSQSSSLRSAPISLVALKAATELNDILNALGLRVALLRHRSNREAPSSVDMERVAGLVDKAVECVRNLQDYIRAEQLVGAIRTALYDQQIEDRGQSRENESRMMRVLLIGGERSDDTSIKRGLERSGCEVTVAGSAAEGLKALENEVEFDNIVCDSEILAANGWKFAGEVSRAAPAAKVYLLQNDATVQTRVAAGSRR